MRSVRNILAGATVVVIGNGPSLDKMPLDEIAKKYVTFGCNHIYRKPFTPDYYSFADRDMLNYLPLPEDFKPKKMFCRAEACIPGNIPIYPIVTAGFSMDIANFVVFGGSAVYVLLQIALYMGARTVLLIGVDHNYPKTGTGEPGTMFTASGEDNDHFSCADGKGYFLEGKRYCRPSLQAVTSYFVTARAAYEHAGSKIINCTPGTHLEVFEKGEI